MIELDQSDYIHIQEEEKIGGGGDNLCTKSMESCPLVASQILAEFRPERAAYKTLRN